MTTDPGTLLRRGLVLAGLLGSLGAVTMLPTVIGLAIGNPMAGDTFVYRTLHGWVNYQTLFNAGVFTMLAGALCVLLLVSGRWPVRILAVLAVVPLVYGALTFAPGGYWRTQMAINFDATPYFYYVAATFAVLLALSVLAFFTAVRFGRPVTQSDA